MLIARAQRLAGRAKCRRFNSRAEHEAWIERVSRSRMPVPAGSKVIPEALIPSSAFLFSQTDPMIERLVLESVPMGACRKHTPAASYLQARWPVSSDALLRQAVADVGSRYCGFRQSKFYEAVDALTCDVATRHTDGLNRGLSLVTASHFNSIQLRRSLQGRDLTLRCYVTSAGSSSLEVRTDALQLDHLGNEVLVQVCHTTMVAVEATSGKVAKGAVPLLALGDGADDTEGGGEAASERFELAALHKTLRASVQAKDMCTRLRSATSHPPTQREMARIHELQRAVLAEREAPAPRAELPDTIEQHTVRSRAQPHHLWHTCSTSPLKLT
jgi:acyl-CoA hydrolase